MIALTRKTFAIPAVLAVILVAGACDSDPAGPGDDIDEDALAGGVLATFEVSGEEFRLWTDDSETIAQLEALEAGESQANIPNGVLAEGPGRGDHNAPWGWHMDPDGIQMAEITVEVCDGRPSMVEDDLDYWIDQVGHFCPWGAELVELRDFR